MALPPGAKLGPYEVLSAIGAGGMGEVYRARDARLGRDVAIKVLPPGFADDADRLRRFEQEARATAALNHPNILAVHDIGTHATDSGQAAPYIVSELLDGETLRERLAKRATTSAGASSMGGLSVRKAIDYAVQIARGLAAAHDKGIVHRDLKPENLFVTNDGHVKILDFGLAKLRPDAAAANAEDAVMPTEAIGTQRGVLLGTMGYMAPEQVRGQAIDHRADIFAFGAVLYEMLSGQRAFHGGSPADTISAILDKEPADLPVVERHIPPALERVVDRCLSKNPSARFQATSDLAFALEALSSHSDRSEIGAAAVMSPAARWNRERVAWSAAAVCAIAGAAAASLGALGYLSPAPAAPRTVRSTVLLPENAGYAPAGTPAYRLSISPDGTKIAIVATAAKGSGFQIWVRPLDALTSQPLTGTENETGAVGTFWSADSRFIGYIHANPITIKKIDAAGGPPLTLAQVPGANIGAGGAGATWNKDDVILFGTTGPTAGPIRRVSGSGGDVTEVIQPDKANGEAELWYPYFLPDGDHFFFLAMGTGDGQSLRPLGIYLSSLSGKERKLLIRGGSNMKLAEGHLLFLRDGTLMAQPFDNDRLELTGTASPVVERIQVGGPSGLTGPYAVSETGVLAYISGPPVGASAPSELTWITRDGKLDGTLGEAASYSDVELSRDGSRAAVGVAESAQRGSDIWVFDIARGLRTKFTFSAGNEFFPVWTANDSHIVYYSAQTAPSSMLQKRSDGSGSEDTLFEEKSLIPVPQTASADGRYLSFLTGGPSAPDVWVLPLTGDRKPVSVLATPANELYTRFSPDGRWLAYVSNESGRSEVYVMPFPGPGGKSLVSTGGGTLPRWNRNGAELFYVSQNNKLMSATVDGRGSAFRVGAVKPLFDVARRTGLRSQYDVTPDGQRFLFNLSSSQPLVTTPPITLVVNWAAGLKTAK